LEIDLQEQMESAKVEVKRIPPPAPMAPPRIGPPPTVKTPLSSGGGLDSELLRRAMRKRKAKVEKTLEDELIEINEALSSAGKSYSVPNVTGLQAAKRAAGLGSTKRVAVDFKLFKKQLILALELGAFDDIDGDDGAKATYARNVKAAILNKDRKIGLRKMPDGETAFSAYTVTFRDCGVWADRVTERGLYSITPHTLAELICARLGSGALGGVFPGEAIQQSVEAITGLPEAKMKERILADREFIMGVFGRDVAQALASSFPEDKPELTGSLLAPSVKLNRVPEDVDVNVSTSGSDRLEQFMNCVDHIDGEVFSVLLSDIGQTVTIFPKMATKVDGRVAEFFYAYSLNYIHQNKRLDFETSDSVMGTLVPVDLEIKDVGGEEWTSHLKDGAEERTTNPDKTSKGRWLLVDILNRIHLFREQMRERLATPDTENDEIARLSGKAREERWYELVTEAVTEESERKKLFEKLHVFGNMAMLEFTGDAEMQVIDWLSSTVTGSMIDAFEELFVIGCSKDKRQYTEWLLDAG